MGNASDIFNGLQDGADFLDGSVLDKLDSDANQERQDNAAEQTGLGACKQCNTRRADAYCSHLDIEICEHCAGEYYNHQLYGYSGAEWAGMKFDQFNYDVEILNGELWRITMITSDEDSEITLEMKVPVYKLISEK